MRKSAFLLLILVIGLSALLMTSCDAKNYETKNYDIKEPFSSILIDTDVAKIDLLPSDDGVCKVVCQERAKKYHSVEVKDGVLTIKVVDEEKWYERVVKIDNTKLTVYLPEAMYDAISVKASTGDVRIDNVRTSALDVKLTTGNITTTGVRCDGDVNINLTTGDVALSALECKNLTSTGSTGNVTLTNVVASENITVERSTGDVTFEDSDGAKILVKTSTGSVSGSLLTEKVFVVKSDTGRVDVPSSSKGGECKITTDTGNIIISIAQNK